jgi:hypothetical protein
MRSPNAAQAGGGGHNIVVTRREDGKFEASVKLPDVQPFVADRETEAIRGMTKVLDTYVHVNAARNA